MIGLSHSTASGLVMRAGHVRRRRARRRPLRAPSFCTVSLAAIAVSSGCGAGARPNTTSTASRVAPRPVLGITEDNAQLLLDPRAPASVEVQVSGDPGRAGGEGDNAVARAGEKLGALRPGYVRLLIDWAALQPDPRQPPDLHVAEPGR